MFTGILAAIIPTRATFYFIIGAFVAGFGSSLYISHLFHSHELTAAINNTRAKETGANNIANKHETATLTELTKQKESADAQIRLLQALLKNHPSCSVDPAIVRLLNKSNLPDAAGTAANVATTTATMETATSVSPAPISTNDVIENCTDNKLNAFEPNYIRYRELQLFYADLRECFNKSKWLDPKCARLLK